MGGFGGGASTGGGGGVGPAGRTSSGSYGTAKNARSASGRNEASSAVKKVAKFVATGGITGAIFRAVTGGIKKANKKSKQNTMDYEGQAAGVTPMKSPSFNIGGEGQDNYQGIELAKASTTSATILGPGEIQKEAANNVKGPTTTEMTAGQISLANKRKGRRATMLTSATGATEEYKLSKKSILG